MIADPSIENMFLMVIVRLGTRYFRGERKRGTE